MRPTRKASASCAEEVWEGGGGIKARLVREVRDRRRQPGRTDRAGRKMCNLPRFRQGVLGGGMANRTYSCVRRGITGGIVPGPRSATTLAKALQKRRFHRRLWPLGPFASFSTKSLAFRWTDSIIAPCQRFASVDMAPTGTCPTCRGYFLARPRLPLSSEHQASIPASRRNCSWNDLNSAGAAAPGWRIPPLFRLGSGLRRCWRLPASGWWAADTPGRLAAGTTTIFGRVCRSYSTGMSRASDTTGKRILRSFHCGMSVPDSIRAR